MVGFLDSVQKSPIPYTTKNKKLSNKIVVYCNYKIKRVIYKKFISFEYYQGNSKIADRKLHHWGHQEQIQNH